MRIFTLLLPAVMLSGCGIFTNLVGSWDGTCEFSAYDMDVEIDIEEDKGGELTGEAEVSFLYYGYQFELEGEVEGKRDGSDVEIDLDFGENGSMEIVGELTDSDTIEGECTSGGVDADIELER
jgi:hypothetical protein